MIYQGYEDVVSEGGRRTGLFLEIDTFEGESVGNDGKGDKVVVRDEFRGGECGEGVDEEFTAALELPDGKEVEAVVHFEAVAAVPVTALLDEAVGNVRRRNEQGRWTYVSALARYVVIRSLSAKKKPMRTIVRTMSMREPRPGVFSRASFWASMARS